MSRAALIAAGALLLAAAGCGGDGDASSAAGGGARDPSAIKRLTPAQYRAIEDTYVAMLPVDRLTKRQGNPSRARIEALVRPLVVRCDGFDRDDPLLGTLAESCLDTVRVLLASPRASDCATQGSCKAAVKELRAAASELVRSDRAANRVLAATRLPPTCKRALRTPAAAYRAYRNADVRLGALLEAINSNSAVRIRRAGAALAHLDDSALPSTAKSLAAFRAHCR